MLTIDSEERDYDDSDNDKKIEMEIKRMNVHRRRKKNS